MTEQSIRLYKHPEFSKLEDKYRTWGDMYSGDHATMVQERYLWRHRLERNADGSELWAARQQRTRYLNLIEMLVSLWTANFFKKEIDFSEVDELFGDDLRNIDGFGTPFECLIKDQVLFNILLYGSVSSIVSAFDLGAVDTETAGLAASRARPFIDVFDAPQVKDWSLESADPLRVGQFNFFRFEQAIVRPRMTAEDQPLEVLVSESHERTQDGRYVIKKYEAERDEKGRIKSFSGGPGGNDIEASVNTAEDIKWNFVSAIDVQRETGEPITEIPISMIRDSSWVKDAAEEALRFHNLRSHRDNIEIFQGYQDKWVKLKNGDDSKRVSAVGEFIRTVLEIDEDMGAIPPMPTVDRDRAIDQALRFTFKVGLNQIRTLPSDSRATQSESAQVEEKRNTLDIVKKTLGDIEDHVNEIVANYAIFKNVKGFEGKVKFNSNITERDIDTMLKLTQALSDTRDQVPLWRKANMKALVREEDFSDKEKIKINEQIEELFPDEGPVKIQPVGAPVEIEPQRERGLERAAQVQQAIRAAEETVPEAARQRAAGRGRNR